MVRDLFRKPVGEWKSHLQAHSQLLDEAFFGKVSARIRWGIQNGHFDDAFRFAQLGDLAAEALGQNAHFREDLFEAQQLRVEPDVYFSDPSLPNFQFYQHWSPERRRFVDAQLDQALGNLQEAHAAYLDLARQGYLPGLMWKRCAEVSRHLGYYSRAADELALADRDGQPDLLYGPLEVPSWVAPSPILPDSPYPEGWPASEDWWPGSVRAPGDPPLTPSPELRTPGGPGAAGRAGSGSLSR